MSSPNIEIPGRNPRWRRTGRPAHMQPPRGSQETSRLVVLGLVNSRRCTRRSGAETVHAEAELPDVVRLGGVDELRPDDPGVLEERLLHHHPHGVWFGGDVVVAEQGSDVAPATARRTRSGRSRRSPPAG